MSNSPNFGVWSEDNLVKEKSVISRFDLGDSMKLERGRNVIRFLPPGDSEVSPFVVTYQHFLMDSQLDRALSFNCPRIMGQILEERKVPCRVCVRANELKTSGNPTDAKLASKFFAKRRVYAVVIDRLREELGPRVLAFGRTIHDKLLAIRSDKETGGDFTNPRSGFDIVITKKGEGINTEYDISPARENSPLSKSKTIILEWLNDRPAIALNARMPDMEEIAHDLDLVLGDNLIIEPRVRALPIGVSISDDAIGDDEIPF